MDYPQRKAKPQQHFKGKSSKPNRFSPGTRTGRRPSSEYDFFTGGGTKITNTDKESTKTADFTIFYNIAFENVEKVKTQLQNKTQSQQNAFWAEYFWKAHFLSKNTNGYELTQQDDRIITQLIKKVEEIRNYHSHIWHDNSVLVFSDELKRFVEQKYNEALVQLSVDFPGAVSDYQFLKQKNYEKESKLFNPIGFGGDAKNFITIEGRIFFLSFFLTTGQMNQFLQQRTGYKRADMPQFKIKRLLYTFYCNRDGAAITDFNHEDRFIDTLAPEVRQNVFKARTAFKLISYLMDYPDYWGSNDAMPLFDNNNELIKNVEQLKDYIESKNILPELKFTLIDRKIKASLELEEDAETLKKEQEDKHSTGTIAFTYDELSGFSFHINFEALHRLVLLQTLHHNMVDLPAPLAILAIELKKQANNRTTLYDILIKPIAERTDDEQVYLLTKENQYLRGGRKVTELGIIFF